MDRFEKLNILISVLGSNNLVVEIVKAMSEEQAEEIFSYICRNWDIDYEVDQFRVDIDRLD